MKRKEFDMIGDPGMGLVIVSVCVSVIAIVGLLYFNYQDKKEEKRNKGA